MKLLLPDDQSEIVIDTAVKISSCMEEEKIVSWMNKHINPACFQPEFYTDEMISINMSLWRDPTLALFFSGRVVHMLAASPDPQGSWQRYNGFLVILVNANILQKSDLQTVCLKLFITFTKQDTMVRIGHCLCELAEKCTLGFCSKELGECLEVA